MLSAVPLPWKIGAALVLAATVAAGAVTYRAHVYQLGFEAAVSERAAADADAVALLTRTQDNAALAIKQAASNITITEVKHEELAPVRERIVTQRVHVCSAICGPAAQADTESAAGSHRADSTGRLFREDVDRDIRALKLAVEEHLATGRACQAFLDKNGLVP